MNTVPELVTLHVWRTSRAGLPRALARMALDPRRLRTTDGVRFGKLLGTGTGTGFGPGDADLTRCNKPVHSISLADSTRCDELPSLVWAIAQLRL